MKKYFCLLLGLTLACLFGYNEAYACRIVPVIQPTTFPNRSVLPIQVRTHQVTTTINNGIAVTVLETVFYNPNNMTLEGTYLFPLPDGSVISQFSMWIDGREMPAELLDADKARNLYISIVQRMIDPALLEFVGRQTFKMRIFPLTPNGEKRIRLSYQEVLTADGNLLRYTYPLTTVGNGREDTLGQVNWEVRVSSEIPLTSVFSPTHTVRVVKEERTASVSFAGTNIHPDRDFVLYISRSAKNLDLTFIPFRRKGEDGYFMLTLAPKPKVDPKEANPKDVVFMIDTSGSMVGDRIQQAKAALKYCIQQLKPEDRFNVIPFSTEANPYKDALMQASPENIKAALRFVEEEIYARGGTNIEEAMDYGLQMVSKTSDRPYFGIFLTDGKPTIGLVDAEEILAKVKKANQPNLRLFTFGVGEELNTKLLDRLAEENRGAHEYVTTGEDIEIKVSSFFDKISAPVVSDIKIQFPSSEKVRITDVYPRQFPDLFKGSYLTLFGRYTGTGDQAIRVKGTIGGKEQEFVFEVPFPEEKRDNDQVPRLWAVRKVGFLLDQIRLHGEDTELKQEVVRLARQFGIVTPYTSYLIVEDSVAIPQTARRGMVPPMPFVEDEENRSPTAPEPPMERAKSAMRAESGRDAVAASQELRKMQEASSTEDADRVSAPGKDDKARPQTNQIRKIAEKTFYLDKEVWCDSEYYTPSLDKSKKHRIEYLSQDYLNLLRDEPGMGKFLAIGPRVIVIWKSWIYEIYTK